MFDSEGLVQLSKEHHMIHAGHAFHADFYGSVDAGTPIYYQLKTGLLQTHLKEMQLAVGTDALLVSLFELPTLTNGTTTVPILARNRIHSSLTLTIIYSDPSDISDTGTLLEYLYVYGSDAVLSSLASNPQNLALEWVLKCSSDYLFKIENLGDGSVPFLLKLFWYEI